MNSTLLHTFLLVAFSLLSTVFPTGTALANGGTSSYAWDAAEMDWPHWRGPEMNGISREKGIVESWKPHIRNAEGEILREGENITWQREDLAGRSTPIVMNGKLYVLVRDNPASDREGEKVVCVDAATGQTLWENRFNVFLSDVPNTRVGWSSVVGDPVTGDVYAQGVCDLFLCIDGETGETKWSHSLSEEYGVLNTYGGRTNFPVIAGNLVITGGIVIGWGENAKPAHRLIAFDKRNGQPVWYEGTRLFPYDTNYSSFVTTVFDGKPALVFGSGDGGVHAFQPQTGRRTWSYEVSRRGINTTPVVAGNLLVCGHSEENAAGTKMGALFALDGRQEGMLTDEDALWKHEEWYIGKSSPLVVDDRVYACEDGGTMFVADLKTGEKIGEVKLRGPMRSSPLYADGKIYCFTENTIWWTFKPTEQGVDTLYRARVNAGSSYGSPIVSHGRMYVPTTQALYCVGKPDTEPSADPRPEPPAIAPRSDDPQPVHVQVVPVESLLKPGQRQQLAVRLYNSNGQYLQTVDPGEVEFSFEGPGRIDAGGRYEAPSTVSRHEAVYITAKVGELTGEARVRVVPRLPWKVDFSGGVIPEAWVGMRYRHIPLDYDLYAKLKSENERASEAYVYLMSGFVNSGRTQLSYDDTTPKQNWSAFLRFFGLEFDDADRNIRRPRTVQDAGQEFNPALDLLKAEGVLEGYEWTTLEGDMIRLTVTRGPREIDGNGVMCKITTIPKGARSQGWMSQPGLSNYTITADVLGTSVPVPGANQPPKMPDIGVQAQRYRLELRATVKDLGGKPGLKLYSWIAHEIKYKVAPFDWQPDTWYTMKLRASVEEQDGREVAVLKGKVWPREEEEPAEWQIEWTDAPPNTHGSPGLFGEASNAELFVDNIRVEANE